MPESARPCRTRCNIFAWQSSRNSATHYRTAHNPPTPELLDACDRIGLMVMDESRTLGSDEANLRRWETQVRRDRNHPSVILLEPLQ